MILDSETKNYLQYIVAKTFYSDVTVAEIKKVVDDLMKNNMWHDDFLLVMDACSKSDRADDIIHKFINALKEMKLEIPQNKEQAFWHICRYHISFMAKDIKPVTHLNLLMSDFDWEWDEIEHYRNQYKLDKFISVYIDLDDYPNLENEVVKKSYSGGKWYNDNIGFIEEMTAELISSAKEWLANLEVSMESFLEELAKVCRNEMIDYNLIKQDDGKLEIEIRSPLEGRYLKIQSLCDMGFNLHFNVEGTYCFDENEWENFEYPTTAYKACLTWINGIVTEERVAVLIKVPRDHRDAGRIMFGRVIELKDYINRRYKTMIGRENSYYIRSFKGRFDEDISCGKDV